MANSNTQKSQTIKSSTIPGALSPQQAVEITDELAGRILAANPCNRAMSKPRVRQYEKELKRGGWKVNGTTVTIDSEGNLVDGQHRLQAIVNTGISAKMFIIYGVDPDVRPTVDSGRIRKIGDDLHMLGNTRGGYTGAGAKLAMNYLDGARIGAPRAKAEVYDFIRDNPEIHTITDSCLHVRQVINPRALIAAVFLGTRAPELRDEYPEFLTGLDTGADYRLGDARLALREAFSLRRIRNEKITPDWALSACVLAWSEWATDKHREKYRLHEASDGEYWPPNIMGGPRRGDGLESVNNVTLSPKERELLEEVMEPRRRRRAAQEAAAAAAVEAHPANSASH